MTDLTRLRLELDRAVAGLPAAEVPDLIGLLAATAARAQVRLQPSAPAQAAAAVTAEVVAERFALPVSKVYEMARQGRIPSVRIGKYRRFYLEAVARALQSERPARGAETETPSLRAPKKPSKRGPLRAPATAVQPIENGRAAPDHAE